MLRIDDVLARLSGVARSGDEWAAQCPAPEHGGDSHASLTIRAGTKAIVVKCHKGCNYTDVLRAIDIKPSDVFYEEDSHTTWTPHGEAIAIYDYRDEDGVLLFQVCRTAGKQFPARVPDVASKTGWTWKLGKARRVIYKLPQVLKAIQEGTIIYIVEGERDVEALGVLGKVATCNAGGAGKWKEEYSPIFAEAEVIVVADKDKPGQLHARQVAESLRNHDANVTLVECADYKDVSEMLAGGVSLVEGLVVSNAFEDEKTDLVPDLHVFLSQTQEYDWCVPGLLERGDRVIITAGEGRGKLLRLDQTLPTEWGWSTIGSLQVGDKVFARDGSLCSVLALSDVEPNPNAYAVHFSDGSIIEADAKHQWLTVDYPSRNHGKAHVPQVRTTEEIRNSLRARGGHCLNHAVPVANPLELPDKELPIPPYTLGVWLGDGDTAGASLTLNRNDVQEIEDRLTKDGFQHHRIPSGDKPGSVRVRVSGLQKLLRLQGLVGDKHIPLEYLRASKVQREELLIGLMDTDGWVTKDAKGSGRGHGAARCELTLMCKTLAYDSVELIRTLGISSKIKESDATLNGKVVGRRWRMQFQTEWNPFTITRKSSRWEPLRTRRSQYRYIKDVQAVAPTPMRCIQVDSVDSTYLVGENLIPTHNSTLMRQMSICIAAGIHPFFQSHYFNPAKVLYIDCENGAPSSRRKFSEIYEIVKLQRRRIEDGFLRIDIQSAGLDLTKADDAERLSEKVMMYKPDVLIIGPLYRLHASNPNDEQSARQVAAAIDNARLKSNCAVIMEGHASHSDATGRRALRPTGSSLWMRWAGYGYGMESIGGPDAFKLDFKSWRGDREERDWPTRLERTNQGMFPWEGAYDNGNPTFGKMKA